MLELKIYWLFLNMVFPCFAMLYDFGEGEFKLFGYKQAFKILTLPTFFPNVSKEINPF